MRRTLLVVAFSALFSPLITSSSSFGAVRPSASPAVFWHFSNSAVDEGASIKLTYSTSGLKSGSFFLLQSEFGTQKVWRTVISTKAKRSGTLIAPGRPTGKYEYRAQIVYGKRTITHSSVRDLFSYGTVNLTTLFNSPQVSGAASLSSGTVEVGSNLYSYEMAGNVVGNGCGASQPPRWCTEIQFPKTSCRTMNLTFALQNGSDGSDAANVQIIQTTLDPESSSTNENQVGHFKVTFDGGPWYLQDNSIDGDQVYYAGSASCWTQSGQL